MKSACSKKAIFQNFVTFINFVFNEPVSSTDYIPLNGRIVDE
jgi:hypothetical protein